MKETVKKAFQQHVANEPFAKIFDLKLVEIDEGYSKVQMKPTEDMKNIFGMIHGGAIFALIDEAFETASNSHGSLSVALNMNVTYLRSPAFSSVLTAEAKEIHRTRKTATYEIRVSDEEDNLIATCQALVYRKEKPLPFFS